MKVTACGTLNEFEQAAYDAAMRSMRPYLSQRRDSRSNIGEMSVVATAIALSIPTVLMDDSEAEHVISAISGLGDQISVFRSVAVVRAARILKGITSKIERACVKAWTSKTRSPMPSEDGTLLIKAVGGNMTS